MGIELDGTAPYAPAENVLLVIRRCRDKGLLDVLNTQELLRLSVPEGNATRTLRALRFLGLVDNDERSTPAFARLCQASSEEYPQILGEILRAAYKDIFVIIDPVDTTLTQLHDAFRACKPQAQRRRMVRLFTGLCREAELMPGGPLESRLRNKTFTAGRGASVDRKSRGLPTQQRAGMSENGSQQVGTGANESLVSRPSTTPSNLDTLGEEYMVLTGLLLKQLPSNRQWTAERREQWLKAHATMVDLLIRIEEPSDKDPQRGGGNSELTPALSE